MASTFTLDSRSYQGRYLQLYCTQQKDTATNKSTINWTLSSIGGSSNYYSTGPTTVIINGVQVYYKAVVAWNDYIFPAAKGSVSGSLTVQHDNEGNAEISASISTQIGYDAAGTWSGTWTLDSILRQAKITSATNFNDTNNPTIYFSNPGGFPMDVWLEPNPVGDHLCVRTGIPNTGSYTWSITDAEREALRNKCSGNSCAVRLGLYTHIGDVLYADYKDMTFVMTENAATKPSVSMDITLDNGQLPSTFDGLYIQGKSRLNVSLSAQGKYSAGINSYWGTVEGKTYNGSPFTTDVIQGSGTIGVVGYAKDARDFTGYTSNQINVIPYSKPLVIPLGSENAILCYRSNGNGIRTGNSTSVWVKVKRAYYPIQTASGQKNFCPLQWRCRLANEDWNSVNEVWKDLIPREDTSTDEYSGLLPGYEFDLQKSYVVHIKAHDDIGDYEIKAFDVPTQDVALHLGAGGKNVSIGSYCDYSKDYTFHSEWKAIFDQDAIIHGILSAAHLGPIGSYHGLDFNDLTTKTGYYIGSSVPSYYPGTKNYPVDATGMLTVVGNGGFAYQTYTTHAGAIYTRSYYVVDGWTAWKQIQMI